MNQREFWQEIYHCTKRHFNWMFIVSATILTFVMTLNYSVIIEYDGFASSEYEVSLLYAAAAMIVMVPPYWYLAYKKQFVMNNIRKMSTVKGWLAFIISVLICRQLIADTQNNYTHIIDKLSASLPGVDWQANLELGYFKVVPVVCILAFFGIFIFIFSAVNLMYYLYLELVCGADRNEKIYFGISLLQCLLLIGFFYSRTQLQWNSLDRIYQTDSIFVYDHYYPVWSMGFYFDWDIGNGGIRHPLTTLYTYPIYLLVSALANLFFFVPYAQAVFYAVIHSVLMILMVIMLKRLIKSNWIYLIFNLSFPFLFFSIFLEKYQLATFFIVMYAYSIIQGEGKRDELKKYSLIAASGTMTTSALLGIFYEKGKSIKERLMGYAGLAAEFFLVLIGSGRSGYIWNFAYLFDHNFVMFNGKSAGAAIKTVLTAFTNQTVAATNVLAAGVGGITLAGGDRNMIPKFVQQICTFFNMLASCFFPVSYHTQDNGYGVNIFYWESIRTELNMVGIIVCIVVIAVFVKHRKEKTVQIFSVWILWAFIQFGITGFSADCTPLFSLYFGWAVIPMVLIGMKDVLRKPIHQFLGYGMLAAAMLYTNYVHLNDLYLFMLAG